MIATTGSKAPRALRKLLIGAAAVLVVAAALFLQRHLVAAIDHVGLGSDFDGSVATGFDTAHIDAVTAALLAAGLDAADVAKVMGGNAARIIGAGIVPLGASVPAR